MSDVDFELRIHSGREGAETIYSVSAGCALAGEVLNRRAQLRLSALDLQSIQQGLHLERTTAWRNLTLLRFVEAPSLQPKYLGSLLFQTFFAGDIGTLFFESLASLRRTKAGALRVKIRLDAQDPELASLNLLPWELLYDERHAHFLALSGRTSVVRHLMVQQPFESHPIPSRLRVLVVAANPLDSQALEIERECQAMRTLGSSSRGVGIEVLPRSTLENLAERLEGARSCGRPFHVLHIIGHGSLDPESGQGGILLSSDENLALPVSGEQMARELADQGLRLVFLNACLTTRTGRELVQEQASLSTALASVAGALTLAGIPQVVAMHQPISDSAAFRLSEVFYRRVLEGESTATALQAARFLLTRESATESEWGTPVLIQRVPDQPLYQRPVPWRLRVAVGLGMLLLGALVWLWLTPSPGPCEQRVASHIERRVQALAAEVQQGSHDLQKLHKIRADLLRIVESHGDYALALSTLAFAEEWLGLLGEAGQHFRAAAERLPGCAHHHYNLGSFARRQGDLEAAVLHLRHTVELDPKHLAARSELGATLLDLQVPDEARQVLREGVERAGSSEPQLASLLKNLGRAELECGDPQAALYSLIEALETTPLGDWQAVDEIHLRIAEAHGVRGDVNTACRYLRARFGDRTERKTASEHRATQLAKELDCPFDTPSPLGFELADRDQGRRIDSRLLAIVTRVETADNGGLTGTRPSLEAPPVSPRRVRPWELLPQGSHLHLGPGASLSFVCSDERLVSRQATSHPEEISIDEETCRLGRPLPPGSFRSLLPDAGRLIQVGGSLALERATRHPPHNPLAPRLLQPRNSAVLDARPTILWTAVEDAFEYEVELVGPHPFRLRIPTREADCEVESAWQGRRVCSMAWPEHHPGLAPGSVSFLQIGARTGLAQPLLTDDGEAPSILRLDPKREEEVRQKLLELDKLVVDPPIHNLLAGALYAEMRLYSDAVQTYLQSLEATPIERWVAVGDLFLRIGLPELASNSYQRVLRELKDCESNPRVAAALAAAEQGLGKVLSMKDDARSAAHFDRSRRLNEELELAEFAAEAAKAKARVQRRVAGP